MPVRRHATRAGRDINNDQVRRWREVFNEEAEMPGAQIPGLCRSVEVARTAGSLAAVGGFCIRISQVSRMFHPASVGVSDAMQPPRSLSRC